MSFDDPPLIPVRSAGFSSFALWLFGTWCWFLHQGLQFVLVPTLVIVTLGLGAAELSYAQIALLFPQLILLLFTGTLADRINCRKLLIIAQGVAALPPAIIFWLLWDGRLTYESIIFYSIGIGISISFVLPARDALLARVNRGNIQRAVTLALITQFGGQLFGYALAAFSAPFFGPLALPAFQVVGVLLGVLSSYMLPDFAPHSADSDISESLPSQIVAGIKVVSGSERLYPIILTMLGVGIFFVGVVMVSIPLIVRDVFGGGQLEISIGVFSFFSGTITSMSFLMMRVPILRRGRLLCLGTLSGSCSLFLLTFAPNFVIFCLIIYIWGLSAGANMSMGRTIIQVETPPVLLARVLALYSLCFIGTAPLGAALLGFLTVQFGAQQAPVISSVCMFCFALWLIFVSPAWGIVRRDEEI